MATHICDGCILLVTFFSVGFTTDVLDYKTQNDSTTSSNTIKMADNTWNTDCPVGCTCYKGTFPSNLLYNAAKLRTRKMKTINCFNNGFDVPPRKMATETEILLLNNNSFINLQKLPYTPSIIYLDLSNNTIETMGNYNLFSQFKKLRYLTLRHNKLSTLLQGSFSGLMRLEYLDLSYNQLENLSIHSFHGLNRLQKLNLAGNLLRELSYAWFEDVFDIKELDLSDNLLTSINAKDFYALSDLNLLNLSNNRIKNIDKSAFQKLQNLFILDLNDNQFINVPTKSIQVTKKLKKITLDGNPIVKLQKGDFFDWNITSISICYMQKLLFIGKLAFENLVLLSSIEIHDNPKLIYIDGNAFQNVPNLKILYIHNNQLTALSPRIMDNVPSLKQIHMYHNPLRCDCNAFWVKELTEEVKVKNFSKPFFNQSEFIKCDFPLNVTGVPIQDVEEARFDRVCAPSTLPSFKESYILDLGQELRLECHTYGVPEPTLSWILPNGSQISGNVSDGKYEINDICVLIVRHLTTQDNGTYGCKADNGIGYDISSTKITVTNKPVRLVPFTVSHDYISMSWNGTKHSAMISDYQLHYREVIKGNELNNNSVQTSAYRVIPLGPQYHSYTVTHLKPQTQYEFCIVYVYDTELYKVDCKTLKTTIVTEYKSAIKKIVSEKIVAGICTALGLIMAVACMVTLVKKFRFHKLYDTPYDTDESETINIPLENVYQPLSAPLCSSKTSLLSINTQRATFDEY